MKRSTFLFAALLALVAPSVVRAVDKPEVVARRIAEEWLGKVDEGKYAESWKDAAEAFQSKITAEKWEEALNAVRKPLGKPVSRSLLTAQYKKEIPGAPEGEYVVILFETVFPGGKQTVETITPMLGKDGTWRVSGYYIK